MPKKSIDPIIANGAGVKIMRSHDYCHFEITLSTSQDVTAKDVDEMRKTAMRLADQAVEQYKIARKVEERLLYAKGYLKRLRQDVEYIQDNIPEGERTPEHQAKIKTLADYEFQSQFEYDYEDDFDYDEWDYRPDRDN